MQINDLTPGLELFVEHTIQPGSEECDALLQELNRLQESIVIYRYLKQNKELSPSFNLHSRISEVSAPAPQVEQIQGQASVKEPEVKVEREAVAEKIMEPELKEVIIESVTVESATPTKAIAMAINDKFRFINELFSQNSSEFNIAIEQLNSVKTMQEAELYLAGLQSVYNWNETREIVKHFYATVKKRFE